MTSARNVFFFSLLTLIACGDDDGVMDAGTSDVATADVASDMATSDVVETDGDTSDTSVADDMETGDMETGDMAEADMAVADTDTDTGAMALSFQTDVWPIIQASCTGGRCHTRTFSAEDVMASYDWLLSATSADAEADCFDNRVTPGDTGASSLIQKINGTGCGDRMPLRRAALSAAEIALIESWVAMGAAR